MVLGSNRVGSTGKSREKGVAQVQSEDAVPRDTRLWDLGLLLGIPSPAEISQLSTAEPRQGGFCCQPSAPEAAVIVKARLFSMYPKDLQTLPSPA